MSDLNLRTLATFATPEEAHALRGLLESQGLRVALEGETTVGLMWYIGNAVGGVKVQVPAEEWDRAVELLSEVRTASSSVGHCSECGLEIDGGFDVCWSCGAVQSHAIADDEDSGSGRHADAVESVPDFTAATAENVNDGDSDSRSQLSGPPPTLAEQTVLRAWRAAVFSILLPFGLLNLYSLWLLMSVAPDALSAATHRRFVAALIVDAGMLALIAKLFLS